MCVCHYLRCCQKTTGMAVNDTYVVTSSSIGSSDLAPCICASNGDGLVVVLRGQHGTDIRNLAEEIRLSGSE
jgi:hypothetical protein